MKASTVPCESLERGGPFAFSFCSTLSSLSVASILSILAILAIVAPATAGAQTADDLKCFKIKDSMKLSGVVDLDSADFGLDPGCRIKRATAYCVPVESTVVEARDAKQTLSLLDVSGPNPGDRVCYRVRCSGESPASQEVSDRFGNRTLRGLKTSTLCVPAVKGAAGQPAVSTGVCSSPGVGNRYILDCNESAGYVTVGTTAPISGSPELHIFSIYEAGDHDFGQHVPAPATVTVERQARVVLVLVAYEPVDWTIDVAPGATLDGVIVSGYHEQTVVAPPGVPVDNRSPWDNGAFENTGYVDWPEWEVLQLVGEAEAATGLCMTSIHGCYEGAQLVVPEP